MKYVGETGQQFRTKKQQHQQDVLMTELNIALTSFKTIYKIKLQQMKFTIT